MKIINLKKKKRGGSSPLHNAAALVVAAISVVCLISHLGPQVLAQREAAVSTAVGFIMPGGVMALLCIGLTEEDIDQNPETEHNQPEESSEVVRDPAEAQSSSPPSSVQESSSQTSSARSQAPAVSDSGTPIQELAIQNSGVQYENISVKNTNQNHKIDIKAELGKRPVIKIQTDNKSQVLIYYTHTMGAYSLQKATSAPLGVENRNTDTTRSVIMVGNAIAAQLRAAGTGVVHDTIIHDPPAYSGSYNRSKQIMAKNLKQYPSIQVVLDTHRNAMTTSNGTRYKPTAVINGKRATQVTTLLDCDDDGILGFPDWEYNLRLGVWIQKQLSDLYPRPARPLNFCPRQYDLNMTKGPLLVEVGTEVSTVGEAVYFGGLFGTAPAKTLLGLK